MNENLKMLFVDNPYIAEQVYTFCKTLPEFQEAEQEFHTASDRIEKSWARSCTSTLKTPSPGIWRSWSTPIISSDWACVKRF